MHGWKENAAVKPHFPVARQIYRADHLQVAARLSPPSLAAVAAPVTLPFFKGRKAAPDLGNMSALAIKRRFLPLCEWAAKQDFIFASDVQAG